MRKILAAWLFGFVFASLAPAIQVGDSQSDVTKALGIPMVARQMPDGVLVWRFKDGTTVRLEGGIVREIEASSVRATIPAPKVAPAPASAATSAVAPEGRNSSAKGRRYLGYILMAAGGVLGLSCSLMFLVLAYRAGVIWLLVCIFVPLGTVIFAIGNWNESKKLLALQFLVAVPLMLLGIYLTPN